MSQVLQHRWIVGERSQDRIALAAQSAGHQARIMSAHRRLRGPYTATGDLLRQIVPIVYERWPELITRHVVEILSIAPELRSIVPASRETLTSLAIPEERTRFYSRLRTLRLTHGIIDFLKKVSEPDRMGRLEVVVDHIQACEPTDAEFFAALLRRMRPEQIGLTLCSTGDVDHAMLQEALPLYAQRVEVAVNPLAAEESETDAEQHMALAKRFVDSDCLSDDLSEQAAYASIEEATRQQLHDERADMLIATNEFTWKLGAIPWHRERGSSPEGAVLALREALEYSINMGYYHTTIDLGIRGRQRVTWSDEDLANMWAFTTKMTTSYAALSFPEKSEELYNEARANTTNGSLHMQAAYATAMLYTRHHTERDHSIARKWIDQAIHIASLITDEKKSAFQTVFYQNGLALIELHVGNIEEALRLVTEGLAQLDQVLEPNEHLLHRSVLIFNKAQILSAIKRYEEATEAYTKVISYDPNYPEYYFDRGNLYSNQGLLDLAIADYTHAIEISPPFPELYYNRAGANSRIGEVEKAFADYSYLLEIEPQHLDGRLNRATLALEAGDTELARRDVEAGLAVEPNHAQLLCTLGLIEMAEEQGEAARQAFTAALDQDPTLLEALANLSVLLFEQEDAEGAIAVLNRGLEAHPQADVLYFNRAWAHQSLGRWQAAVDDYTAALNAQSEEAFEIFYQRGCCLFELGLTEEAHADWKRHLEGGESPYLEEIQQLAPALG